MKIRQSADKNWEYLFGVFLGDGCVTLHTSRHGKRRPCFRLNTIDEDFARAVETALRNVSNETVCLSTHSVSKSSKPNHSLWCGDPAVCARFEIETAGKTKLPDWIWNSDQAGKLAFISGLMDSEGYATINGSGSLNIGFKSCDVWVDDFVRLLNSAGIEVGKIAICPPLKSWYKTPKRFTIKKPSWQKAGAYFNIQRKQARVDKWAASQLISETNMPSAA